MDFLKKAKTQAKSAMKEAQGIAQHVHSQYQQQQQQRQGYNHPQTNQNQATQQPPQHYSGNSGAQHQQIQDQYNYQHPSTQGYQDHNNTPNYHQQPPQPQVQQQHYYPPPAQQSYQYPPPGQQSFQSSQSQVQDQYQQFNSPPPQNYQYQSPQPQTQQQYFPAPVEQSHHAPLQQPYNQQNSYSSPFQYGQQPPEQQRYPPPSQNFSPVSSISPGTSGLQQPIASGVASPPQPFTPLGQHQLAPPGPQIQPLHQQHISSPPLPPPPQHAQAVAQQQLPSPPAQKPHLMSSQAKTCPRHEAALVDRVQFYVFTPNLTSKGSQSGLAETQFSVCSQCFMSKISAYSQLASNFYPLPKEVLPPEAPQATFTKLTCQFDLPRVRQLFYQQCVPQNSVDPLIQFAYESVNFTPCSAAVITEPTAFYTGKQFDQFGLCITCFETYVKGTSFESQLLKTAPSTDWYCDVGNKGYIYRAMVAELNSSNPDWNRFVSKASTRLNMPPCPGGKNSFASNRQLGERIWVYGAIDDKTGNICPTCFHDKMEGTCMERQFSYYELDETEKKEYPCDLAEVYSKMAMEAAIRAGDDEVWRHCLVGRSNLSLCKSIMGVDEADIMTPNDATTQWYCFIEHPSIEICPMCYCAAIQLLGAAHLFTPITRPKQPGVVRFCYLSVAKNLGASWDDSDNFDNTLVWRGTMLRHWLGHGYDMHGQGDYAPFKHVLRVIAGWPIPCSWQRRISSINSPKRQWFGINPSNPPPGLSPITSNLLTDLVICAECHEHRVKSSPLSRHFTEVTSTIYTHAPAPKDASIRPADNTVQCATYSVQSKQKLGEACFASDFSVFVSYWAERETVRLRHEAIERQCTIQAQIQSAETAANNSAAYTRLMGQLTANTNATIMGIGGSVAEASAADYGQRFGNAGVGYGYLTSGGAAAAQAHLDAQNLGRNNANAALSEWQRTGDTLRDTQNLLALAKRVREEWEAIE